MKIKEIIPAVAMPLIVAIMGVWVMLLVADKTTQMTRESNVATARMEVHLDWARQYRAAAVDFMTAALISSVYGPGNEKAAKGSARFAYTLEDVKAFAGAAMRLNSLTDDNIASQKAVGDATQEFWYRTVSETNPTSPSMTERDFDETSIFMSATIIELVNVAIAEAEQRTFEEIRSPDEPR
jgi:hypothetical protein